MAIISSNEFLLLQNKKEAGFHIETCFFFLFKNIFFVFFFQFYIYFKCIVAITSGQENIFDMRNSLCVQLLFEPGFIVAGMPEIFLHNMTVHNHISNRGFLCDTDMQVLRCNRPFGRNGYKADFTIGFKNCRLNIR